KGKVTRFFIWAEVLRAGQARCYISKLAFRLYAPISWPTIWFAMKASTDFCADRYALSFWLQNTFRNTAAQYRWKIISFDLCWVVLLRIPPAHPLVRYGSLRSRPPVRP